MMPYNSYTYTDEEWTTEPPTQEGWYWAAGEGLEIQLCNVVWNILDRDNARFQAMQAGNNDMLEFSEFTHWLGPLPVPEIPKG